MLETPYITFRRAVRKASAKHKEMVKYVFEKSDNLSLWIIGISLASISLLISNFKDLHEYLSPHDIKLIFLLFFISSFVGIIHRIFFILYYIWIDVAFEKIDADLSDEQHMDTENNLTGNESFVDLLNANRQFQNVEEFETRFKNGDEESRKNLYNELVALYIKNISLAKQNLNFAISGIGKTYKEYLDVKLNLKGKSPSMIKFAKYTSIILYFIFMLSFLFAFLYFFIVVKLPLQ